MALPPTPNGYPPAPLKVWQKIYAASALTSIESMISEYQDKDIIVELMTHPGYVDDYTRSLTSYIERDKELQVLKESKEKGIFNKIELINFKQL